MSTAPLLFDLRILKLCLKTCKHYCYFVLWRSFGSWIYVKYASCRELFVKIIRILKGPEVTWIPWFLLLLIPPRIISFFDEDSASGEESQECVVLIAFMDLISQSQPAYPLEPEVLLLPRSGAPLSGSIGVRSLSVAVNGPGAPTCVYFVTASSPSLSQVYPDEEGQGYRKGWFGSVLLF